MSNKVIINEVTIGSDDFENCKIKCVYNNEVFYVHASRYIASFASVGGNVFNRTLFGDWLRTLNVDEEGIDFITNFASNGKMELEMSARNFLK